MAGIGGGAIIATGDGIVDGVIIATGDGIVDGVTIATGDGIVIAGTAIGELRIRTGTGPPENIESIGALDLTFACECGAGG